MVVPSECYENCPYSVMEAMALGKPLIVSSYGGLPELVEDGKNGYVYDAAGSGAVDHMETCIRKIFTLPENEYRRIEQRSLDRAGNLFDATQYINKIEDFLAPIRKCGREKRDYFGR